MSRVNVTTWKDLSQRFARPAKVVQEANTTEMKKRMSTRSDIEEKLHKMRLEKEYSL